LLQEKTNWKPSHTMKNSMKEIVDFYMDSKWI
jgi:dTDP-D-glucose 4,6-dehydratase